MVSNIAAAVTFFLQINAVSFFIRQPKDCCSASPTWGYWIYLPALICYLWDIEIFPERFLCSIPNFLAVTLEIIACTFLAEIGTLIIWCNWERFTYRIAEYLWTFLTQSDITCTQSKCLYYVVGLFQCALSGILLYHVLWATDGAYYLNFYARKLQKYIKSFSNKPRRCPSRCRN